MHKSDKIHAHTSMMHSVQALYCNWDCHWDCLRILGITVLRNGIFLVASQEIICNSGRQQTKSLTKILDENALECLASGKGFILDRLRLDILTIIFTRIFNYNLSVFSVCSVDFFDLNVTGTGQWHQHQALQLTVSKNDFFCVTSVTVDSWQFWKTFFLRCHRERSMS